MMQRRQPSYRENVLLVLVMVEMVVTVMTMVVMIMTVGMMVVTTVVMVKRMIADNLQTHY